MTTMPEGCSKTLQISYIENESLRPDPEYKWVIVAERPGRFATVTTCRKTFEDAIEFAREFIGE